MKAVILAGGLGTRISEETSNKPKPMVKIGPYTLLEHIMRTYSRAGVDEFVIATGYLHEIIENYFRNYKDFKVRTIFTGEHTQTGGRIKRIMQEFSKETLCVTYGDGLGNIDIKGSLKFHQKHGKLATVTAVRPTARFGRLTIKKDSVVKFGEKMQSEEGWINGGFFILDKKVAEYISGDAMPFESNPLKILTEKNQLMAFKHLGFWSPVDTLREKNELEELWQNNNAPWTIY